MVLHTQFHLKYIKNIAGFKSATVRILRLACQRQRKTILKIVQAYKLAPRHTRADPLYA